jgi:hypothetical protein
VTPALQNPETSRNRTYRIRTATSSPPATRPESVSAFGFVSILPLERRRHKRPSAYPVDSEAGLGALIGVSKAYAARGGRLLLAAPRPEVRHILQITRFVQHFAGHASEADAVGALG